MILPFLLASAISIRTGNTALRAACDPASEVVTRLDGAPVQIKFAFAGDGTACYKVSVTVDGHAVAGYIEEKGLAGLDQFDRGRQEAPSLDIPATRVPVTKSSSEPQALVLAGMTAWRGDDTAAALDYWKRALDLQPNPDLERLYQKVRREKEADQSSGRIVGMRVLLRYEPQTVSLETAREMTQALDTEFSRISLQLGCPASERLVAIVQSRSAYLAASGAAEWSGGQYDGRIRVALVDEAGVGPKTRRAFAHELVHACLANIGRFPAWLHEGLAQRLSGDVLSPGARKQVEDLIAAHAFPKLEQLGQVLARESTDRARAVYALALYAADLVSTQRASTGLPNLLRNSEMLAQATADLDRQLGL